MFPFNDNLKCITRPTAVFVIIFLNCFLFIIEEALQHWSPTTAAVVQTFGMFTPANFTAAFASPDPLAIVFVIMSIFFAMFLHGGMMHILGNMVFLNCFGRAVEARLGTKQFVVFYLGAGIAATVGQYLMNPLSQVPNLGASGAIAGVLSAYLMFWPKAKVNGLAIEFGIAISPAWSYLPWWVGSQVFSIIFEHPHGGGGVAYMAHISGFAAGMVAGLLTRWLEPNENVCYDTDVCAKPAFAK